jgi:preprotein translocase subunit SecA
LYSWLGLTTGVIVHDLTDAQRKVSYGSDITYGTNNEFGFDYLRDNMKFDLEDYVQRELNFAIIDECDSILIDEARTPLIISGPKDDATEKYELVNKVIPHLKLDVHFTMEEKSRTASLTDEGNARVEELLGVQNLYDPEHIDLLHHIYQALKAHNLYKLDVDYMIKDGEIVIVDEFTGRLMPGRRWSDGLHQAIEAKEGVKVRNENQTLATITFQNYFRMYNKMAGMTGTAETEATEFKKIYNLDVQVIPTNRPINRKDQEDVVYKSEMGKYRAMAKDIRERNAKGQPILVGTVSIERSERLSRMLRNEGITHNVLNAKQHEREAEIVAQAGRFGAVTIATNMAGRGTDILLGGNPEFLAKAEAGPEATEERIAELIPKYKAQCEAEKQKVLAAGGLYIMGTERHESRRIDNQLRGRAGRQGDPGESHFYLSLEDNLMRIFNGERIQKIMTTLRVDEDEPITARMVSRAIENAQKRVEGHHFDVRKHLIDYDDVMNQQRTAIYSLRRQILAGEEIERKVLDMLSDTTSTMLDIFIPEEGKREAWNLHGLVTAAQRHFGLHLDEEQLRRMSASEITSLVSDGVKKIYDDQKASIGGFFEQLARMLMLQTIDQRWKEHLERIDHLKEGIHLRAHAQKDPLIEYKKEAFDAFQEVNGWIQEETIEKLLKIRLVDQERAREVLQERRELDESDLSYAGADENGPAFQPAPGLAGASRPQMPQMPQAAPPQQQQMFFGRGEDDDEGPKMNREQRRRMEKSKKKKRI